jgi:hypothetical protein
MITNLIILLCLSMTFSKQKEVTGQSKIFEVLCLLQSYFKEFFVGIELMLRQFRAVLIIKVHIKVLIKLTTIKVQLFL